MCYEFRIMDDIIQMFSECNVVDSARKFHEILAYKFEILISMKYFIPNSIV